ncbi:hypothetical protein Tsp_14203, partial [Trichinella spiralis]
IEKMAFSKKKYIPQKTIKFHLMQEYRVLPYNYPCRKALPQA